MSTLHQTIKWTVGSTLLISALGLGIFGIASASRDGGMDDDYQSEREYGEERDDDRDDDSYNMRMSRGAPADDIYQDECGACHVAYPPGLLPSASWKAIMNGLDDHFGENAELPADTGAHIADFLDRHASDRGDRLKNARLMRDVGQEAPLRITELPYFKREHREIPKRMAGDNPEVRSFSNCDSCHKDAAKGRFDEDTVVIPGFGRWDD